MPDLSTLESRLEPRDRSLVESRDRRRSLYAFLEPIWSGRRVLEIGPSVEGSVELLRSLGAAKVVVSDGDLASVTERFDVVVVPEGEALVRRPGAVAACRKLVALGGRLVVAAGNAERPGASGGVGYYDLHGAVAPLLPLIQMLGMTPFSGIGVVEFDGAIDALRIDSRLVTEPEPPVAYVAVAGTEPVAGLGYALVQLPPLPFSAPPGDAGALPAAHVSHLQAEEIEEMRARVRRAAEDRAALDTENAKLRRALAEANESIMTLTRRTTEEMAAVAERLTAGLRAPLEAEARASAAALVDAREEADRLRVKLAESEARAASAEQRLEELGGLARERQTAVEDALERQRLAESELARARREMARLENGARTVVVDDSALEERSRAVAQRDERILRLEGEKQDLTWRLAELEDKLRQAIARAVQGSAGRAEAGQVQGGSMAPRATGQGNDSDELAAARGRALEEFHRASTAHVDELTELKASVSEQSALVAELEDTLAAAEARAATSSAETTTLRKTAKDLEEADRTRRARLAELEGKLLRLEHERKAAAGRDGAEVDRLHALEAERDRLRVRVGELEAISAAGAGQNGKNNGHDGHDAGAAAIARDLDAVEANLRAEVGRVGGSSADASRLENTLDNYRRRASRLRDDLEGIRRRLESLSPSEISGFLEELGEDLAELGGVTAGSIGSPGTARATGNGRVAGAVRVAIVGLGAIGREVLKAVLARPTLELSGVADPAFVGQDAGEVAGVGSLGVKVAPTLSAALAGADVALVLTLSGVAEMLPVVEAAGAAGVDVVSTCEDLAYADLTTPELAQQLDASARAAGITVVGTGVNPGLVMDRLPLTLAAACVRVDRVAVTRVVDAARRRAPLRAKVGAGMTVAEFEAGVAAKKLGHRGLAESCALLGLGLGFSFDEIRSTIGPVTDPRPGVEAGRVAGLRQSAIGLGGGRELVRLDLEMSVGAPEPHDRVVIEGDPPLDLLIRGGTHGDRATVGTVLNAIPAVIAAAPGLATVLDLTLRR